VTSGNIRQKQKKHKQTTNQTRPVYTEVTPFQPTVQPDTDRNMPV